MIFQMKKSMEAPAWFIKCHEESIEIVNSIRPDKEKFTIEGISEMGKLLQDAFEKMKIGKKTAEALSDYHWGKFRLDNFNNEFGQAENLSYDAKKKIIIIKKK